MTPEGIKRFFLAHYPAFAVGILLMLIVRWLEPFSDEIWFDTSYLIVVSLIAWGLGAYFGSKNGVATSALLMVAVAAISIMGQKYLYQLVSYYYWAWYVVYFYAFTGGTLLGLTTGHRSKFLPFVSMVFGVLSAYWINDNAILFGLICTGMVGYTILSEIQWLLKGALLIPVLFLILVDNNSDAQLFARQEKYTDKVIFSGLTRQHKVDITTWRGEYWYYLNNQNRLSSLDEYLYHEPMVHPVMQSVKKGAKVLILGGELGGTLREVVKYQEVSSIISIPLDNKLVEQFRDHQLFRRVSGDSWLDDRVTLLDEDIFRHLKE
ncbi:MAG: hypothetical protein AAGJ93_15405, partial [Bacteroidota bacterium]